MTASRRLLTPDPDERACFHCQAWRSWGTHAIGAEGTTEICNEPLGQCRIRAPIPGKPAEHGDRPAAWPVVAADDWCLEFRKARQ